MVDDIFGSPTTNVGIDLDFSDVSNGFQITPGTYPAKVIGVDQGTSKSSGNPMITFTYVIMGGKFAGKEFKEFCVMQGAGKYKLQDALVALGICKKGEKAKVVLDNLLGLGAALQIKDDEYNGEARSTIAKVLPHPDGPNCYTQSLSDLT